MSVRYNVSSLEREPVGSTRTYDIDSDVLVDMDEPRHEHVTGHATLLRTDNGVLVTAGLEGAQRERCSRCLLDSSVPLRLEVEEEFIPTLDPRTGAPVPQPDDIEAFRIDEQHMLDLEEAIRQAWTAALPLQPLCRPNCKGLCPRCGQDLNESICSCKEDVDERWQTLRELVLDREG